MLIGGNCADLAECGGSLGDSHMRLVGAVVDMMKGNGKGRQKGWKLLYISGWMNGANSRLYVVTFRSWA